MSTRQPVSPILTNAHRSAPAMTAEAERLLFRAVERAHVLAWFVVLGPECVRDSRRAAILRLAARACDVDVESVLPDGANVFDIDDVPALARRCRTEVDKGQDLLRAAAAVVLEECDDVFTSPRASRASVARALRWRSHVLQALAGLSRLEDRAVKHNLGLALREANRRLGSGVPFDDLLQQGCLGLLSAVRRFDSTRGWRFSTMATEWIRHHVGRYIEDHGRTVRLPNWVHAMMNRVRRAQCALSAAGVEPTAEAIAHHLGEEVERVARVLDASQPVQSLDEDAAGRDPARPGASRVAAMPDRAEPVDDRLSAAESRRHLAPHVSALPPMPRGLVAAVFLRGEDLHTAAAAQGITVGRAQRAIIAAAQELPASLLREMSC